MSLDDQLGFTFTEAQSRRIWRVTDLVSAIRTTIERGYTDVWVEGEISNLRISESGHMYFALKDGDALLRVVMFRLQARLVFPDGLDDGDHVVDRIPAQLRPRGVRTAAVHGEVPADRLNRPPGGLLCWKGRRRERGRERPYAWSRKGSPSSSE